MSLPPAQPFYILRGHAAQIHSAAFIRANTRLVTGDADGWIVVWSLVTKRAVAVWRGHEGVILGLAAWGCERLITHGKDNKLIVWKLRHEDECSMSTALPVDETVSSRRYPWLLHILEVQLQDMVKVGINKPDVVEELLIAVPNTMTSEAVDIFHLPSEKRIYTVPGDDYTKTGMVMAVAIFYQGKTLTLAVGYESGHTMVTHQVDGQGWNVLYKSKPHSQPVLSLDLTPSQSFYMTSSADAIIAKHPIPTIIRPRPPMLLPHPQTPTLRESPKSVSSRGSLLSQSLASAGPSRDTGAPPPKIEIQSTPLKTSQTKHSGQQSLKIRPDGKIFATAGWDARVRVYSAQTLKELAVLKWHKEGCYAVAFADVLTTDEQQCSLTQLGPSENVDADEQSQETHLITSRVTGLVREQRARKAVATHWLAAGSKDGKVSLWNIY